MQELIKELTHETACVCCGGDWRRNLTVGSPQYHVVFREHGTGEPVSQMRLDKEAEVNVRETSTQELRRVRACDMSLDRHSLVRDGKLYDLLNIRKLCARQQRASPVRTFALV